MPVLCLRPQALRRCIAVIIGGSLISLSNLRAAEGDVSLKQPDLPDNTLSVAEQREGWLLLFDGKTTAGWMNSDRTAPRTPVEENALNPHKAGHYMLVHTQQWENFVLSLDFKISKGCNSGIFVRTASLTPRPGKDVGFNGIEVAIDDTPGAGYHDTGALYDLVKPAKNAMKPVGEWNHIEITCQGSRIEVVLNGEKVTRADLDQFTQPNRRPD